MKIKRWWSRKSGWAKVVTVLAVLASLQIGLCFSTPVTVQPVYLAICGPSSDSEFGLGLVIVQAFLCVVTFALLFLAVLVAAAGDHFAPERDSEEKNND